ncbi:MAG: hypothetical protein KGM47_05730 [Acidobacteriota bacterium]|nr:hypothetical protein [Acidobacteriota bacterium]
MNTHSVHHHSRKAVTAASKPITQAARMRAAIDQAVTVGPSFLRGDTDADHMANTMVQAVRSYTEQKRAAGGDGMPRSVEARVLQDVLSELMGCGSGFLAGRCDAACVARTMTQMVHEFGPH